MRDEWADQPEYRNPAPLSEEARKRAARQGLAEARAILNGQREMREAAAELDLDPEAGSPGIAKRREGEHAGS